MRQTLITVPVYQRTLATSVTTKGIGLHSGKTVTMTLCPAPADTGIIFVRTDLNHTQIPMSATLIQDTMMSSNLVMGEAKVGTVEHLLSAVSACGLDNLYVEIDAAEIPIMDGSALEFLKLIDEADIIEQNAHKKFIKLKKEVKVTDGDKWAKISPNSCDDDGFFMSFEIDFDHIAIKNTNQTATLHFNTDHFVREIGQARTFGFLKDLEYLRSRHLALGGSMDNAIVLDDTSVMNEEGLRYPDEFVRHKILDAVGDLYVIGYPLLGQFSAYRSGHALNNALIRAILADDDNYEIVTFYDKNHCPIAYDLPKIAKKSHPKI